MSAPDQEFNFPGSTGWISDSFDDKDRQYVPKEGVTPPDWKTWVNLRQKYPASWIEYYDQGRTSSCTANSVSALYAFEVNKITTRNDPMVLPSRAFVYYNARMGRDTPQKEITLEDGGSAIRTAMRSLQKWGVCDDISWPLRTDTVNWYPGPYAFNEAAKRKIQSFEYKRLDVQRDSKDRNLLMKNLTSNDKAKAHKARLRMNADGNTLLDNLRICLSLGHPVCFGFTFYKPPTVEDGDFGFDCKKHINIEPKWVLADVPKKRRHVGPDYASYPKANPQAHAVLAYGFMDDANDKDENNGWILCQNSWGGIDTNNDLAPTFWMPYHWITDFTATRDFWMIDLKAVEEADAPRSKL